MEHMAELLWAIFEGAKADGPHFVSAGRLGLGLLGLERA
jgi:hypothetical protein